MRSSSFGLCNLRFIPTVAQESSKYRYLNHVPTRADDWSEQFDQVERSYDNIPYVPPDTDAQVMDALQVIFDPADIQIMMRIVACVLHIGNIEFGTRKKELCVDSAHVHELVSRLLSVASEDLAAALTRTRRIIRDEAIDTGLSPAQAGDRRDALAKVLHPQTTRRSCLLPLL